MPSAASQAARPVTAERASNESCVCLKARLMKLRDHVNPRRSIRGYWAVQAQGHQQRRAHMTKGQTGTHVYSSSPGIDPLSAISGGSVVKSTVCGPRCCIACTFSARRYCRLSGAQSTKPNSLSSYCTTHVCFPMHVLPCWLLCCLLYAQEGSTQACSSISILSGG